jgi:hypothetical protein
MVRAVIGMIALAMALAGCDTAGAPPGTPGSVTAYVHGQTVVTIGGALD